MLLKFFQFSYILCITISLAKCAKCPPIIKHYLIAQCKYEGEEFPCTKSVDPGTIALIKCAFMYKNIIDNSPESSYLHCKNDGTWNSFPFECAQICGTIGTKVAFSVNSQVTEVQKVPWQTAIYMKDSNEMFHHICGGTLVKSNVIISAAHCFWDPLTSQLYNESNYIVAVGKFYRDFYANNENSVFQISDVSNIKIPLQFSGADYDFVSDIAVVTLEIHIIFKNHIRPACLPWNMDENSFILNNKSGVVAGWGITNTGTYSSELRSVQLISIDSDDCKKKVTKNNKISNDKFCVNTDEGKNVCRGDSGGGFLVPIIVNNVSYYHLWGIVSNGLIEPGARSIICNSKFVTTFTNVQFYQGFITQLKIFHRDNEYNMGCLVPQKGALLLRNIETQRILTPETYVEKGTKIRYVCPLQYLGNGNYSTNTCDEDWLNPHPECIRACTQLYERSIIPRCYYKEKQIYCNRRRLKPGTIAKIECAFMYQKPQDKLFHDTITCGNDGFWDNLPIQCEQICGTTEPEIKTELIATQSINRRVPWQVSMYVKHNEEYEYKCSGTLVHSKVVLTAARCFWDSKSSTFHDTSNYIVRAGNFYPDYYALNETKEIQAVNISDVHILDSFWGSTTNYSHEVAVISLYYNIIFRNHIRPACLVWEDQNNFNDQLPVIEGWRMNYEGIYHSGLCFIDSLHQYCEQCDKGSSNEKFCVKEKFCFGDNGSGVLIPKIINNVTYYHLLGIFINNLHTQGFDLNRCDSNVTITFNNIFNFKSDIDIIIKNATRYIIPFE